jgi:hypothetical protein
VRASRKAKKGEKETYPANRTGSARQAITVSTQKKITISRSRSNNALLTLCRPWRPIARVRSRAPYAEINPTGRELSSSQQAESQQSGLRDSSFVSERRRGEQLTEQQERNWRMEINGDGRDGGWMRGSVGGDFPLFFSSELQKWKASSVGCTDAPRLRTFHFGYSAK